MASESQGGSSLRASCRICSASSTFFGETDVLKKYRVQYFRCQACGFIQTEEPYWLEEAYSAAIASQDVGIMQRNIRNCELTSAVLNLLFPDVSKAVDYGAGHGMFVRLMRDKGFDFTWYDLHATNDYARGFEYQEGSTYDFLTAFEVLEHLTDPISSISELMDLSDNVFVSTEIVPQGVTALSDWWYFVPSTGQHVSFYTKESLRLLATRFGRNLLSVGPYHLFTKKPQPFFLYRIAISSRTASTVNRLFRRPSLTDKDFLAMSADS